MRITISAVSPVSECAMVIDVLLSELGATSADEFLPSAPLVASFMSDASSSSSSTGWYTHRSLLPAYRRQTYSA